MPNGWNRLGKMCSTSLSGRFEAVESQTHKLGIAGQDVTYQMLFGMERESEAGS